MPFVKIFDVKTPRPPPSSHAPPIFVRFRKICTFADVEIRQRLCWQIPAAKNFLF